MKSASTSRTSNKYHLTIIAALLSMVGPFTIDAYLPSFPAIEAEFEVSRAVLSQSLAVYLAAFAISTLLWGPMSDRIGRRLVILSSLFVYILASIGCALADDSNSFLLLRTLQGFAASGGLIAGRAMIRDAHDTESAHRAMSQVILLFAIAPAIAPVLGAWLHDFYGWRSVFWFLSVFGMLLILMAVFMKETLGVEHRHSFHPVSVIKIYNRTIRHGQFVGMCLSLSFAFAGLFLYIAGAPTVIYDFLHLGSHDFGQQFIPMVAGMMLGAYISSQLAHRWAKLRTIFFGFGIMIISMIFNIILVTFFKPDIYTVIGPLVTYAIGLAMAMPAITIMALDCFPKNRGAAASMQGFFQMMINAGVAGIAVPLLHTQQLHFVLGQLVFLVMALILWQISRRYRIKSV